MKDAFAESVKAHLREREPGDTWSCGIVSNSGPSEPQDRCHPSIRESLFDQDVRTAAAQGQHVRVVRAGFSDYESIP